MLQSVHIKGLAVVESLDLELQSGMTVLTGETGAGKSILLTAMKLCLGERADASLVRPNTPKADISLTFDIQQNDTVQRWLDQHELSSDDECFIRRVINADGRSKAFINDQPVNLKTLQSLSEHLVCIHGQHAHMDLMHAKHQLALVDNALTDKSALTACQTAFEQYKTLQNRLHELTNGQDDNETEKQLLQYQIEELEALNIEHFDYETLQNEHRQLTNAERILMLIEQQNQRLYEAEQHSIYQQLSEVSHALEELESLNSEFSDISEQIKEALVLTQEANRELKYAQDRVEVNPEQLQAVEQRMQSTLDMARKLHVAPEQLNTSYHELCDRLTLLTHQEDELSEIQNKLTAAKNHYYQTAEALNIQRQNAALKLSHDITTNIKCLGLPDGEFSIDLQYHGDDTPSKDGLNTLCFMITTNPGLSPSPLSKTASGGELSRISLAIQVVTTEKNSASTLVFDEVDSGIGGAVAETVALTLRELSTHKQVMCVTHLAQVAAQGHQHLLVEKTKTNGNTQTHIQQIESKSRVDEISRMIGGLTLSERTVAHAEEMLSNANR